jgi:hypothetical protein
MFRYCLTGSFIAITFSLAGFLAANEEPTTGDDSEDSSTRSVSARISDSEVGVLYTGDVDFPSQVCYRPGWPRKPKQGRPGDINLGDCPPARYQMDDCQRAGRPHCIAPWAKCAINEGYSAWFVGGGTAWPLPMHSRQRRVDEGTWGLDYDGLLRPRRTWLNWSCDRHQSAGTYDTDH